MGSFISQNAILRWRSNMTNNFRGISRPKTVTWHLAVQGNRFTPHTIAGLTDARGCGHCGGSTMLDNSRRRSSWKGIKLNPDILDKAISTIMRHCILVIYSTVLESISSSSSPHGRTTRSHGRSWVFWGSMEFTVGLLV